MRLVYKILGGLVLLPFGCLYASEEIAAGRACVDCHGHDSLKISAVEIKKCDSCHASRKVSTQPKDSHEPSSSVPLKATAGMRFPLYYQGSRIGDSPNEMVTIEAGQFIMGTNNRLPDEGPEHTVNLAAFMIDVFEVTNLQYKKFNNATHRRSPKHFRNRSFPAGKADHPVTYVSWNDAVAYCEWADKRLPTDEEWEKAARGNKGRTFPWGDEFSAIKANTPLRWKQVGQFGDTTPVGSFSDGVSTSGVYDMSGNVWEWTGSWYQPYPGNKTASESYGVRYKTLKGGSWFNCSFYNCGISAPVYNRAFFAKRVKNDSFGFRCAKSIDHQ